MAQSTVPMFSAQTFAKLSPHPYMLANLKPSDPSRPSQRTNGRQPKQSRTLQVNTSSLTHANGSAMVRLGDTTVICAVRAESLPVTEIPNYRPASSTGPPLDEIASYDLLVPNIELATGSAPEFLPGVPPTALAQTLSTRLYSLLLSSGMVQVDDLRIWEKSEDDNDDNMEDGDGDGDQELGTVPETPGRTLRGYWALFIDVTFASYDGNPFDAAWIAVLAALHNMKLPRAWWDADMEMVVCSPEGSEFQKLHLEGFPVSCTAAVVTERDHAEHSVGKYWVLTDPDRREEKLCDESICMVVDCSRRGDTKILNLSKAGGCELDKALINEFRQTAENRWQDCRAALE
ncbi:hypothetical protein MKZ38_003514 [Zalerion maritima]|uniref:Ribosomal RNA-processing protein 43 n=1 Tax=Zalerion maritima TaxID=339359 RepID=A0AAD5RWS4_9PEZI|nr:hypothetical protein MKZ38_003514 [Zalerion maritima]